MKSNRTISYGIKYAKSLGYPVIVKPNSKSQGNGVCLVGSEKELKNALQEVFKVDKIAIIERYLPGRDYRIVVLDGEIISAYERMALSVVGDGKSSILALLKRKQKSFVLQERDTRINFEDKRIKIKLQQQSYSFKTVLPKNKKIYLLDNANLSTGGDSLDVTNTIRIAGVDVMVRRGDITKNPKNCSYYIIEINAAPGLDHYVTTGKTQRKIVEAMYLKVLKALGKKDAN